MRKRETMCHVRSVEGLCLWSIEFSAVSINISSSVYNNMKRETHNMIKATFIMSI